MNADGSAQNLATLFPCIHTRKPFHMGPEAIGKYQLISSPPINHYTIVSITHVS